MGEKNFFREYALYAYTFLFVICKKMLAKCTNRIIDKIKVLDLKRASISCSILCKISEILKS